MQSLSRFLLLSTFCAASHLSAQDLAPVNTDSILRELDAIEQQQKVILQSARQNALSRLKAASFNGSTAVDLYVEALEAVEFEGKPNKGASFSEWKSSNGDFLRSNELKTVLQLHLKYLVLSLERATSDKPEAFVAPALAYVNELATLSEQLPAAGGGGKSERDKENQAILKSAMDMKKSLLDKPLAEGIFSKWLHLGPWLPKADSWELVAGNLPGILEKDVRTPMRETKNPQLIQTWDFEMKLLADRATAGRLDYLAADFNTSVRPKMIFLRANDLIVVGQKNRGISDIYMLVKTYPQHPDFSKWVARLRELLPKAAAAQPAAEAAAPATAAPGTAPQ